MKNKSGLRAAVFPLLITISLYLVFYSRIASKPNQAGFWLILAMGMAVGVLLTQVFRGSRSGAKDEN